MADIRKVFRFDGDGVEVAWDGRLCIHVGECTRAQGEIFVSGRKPWCEPDRVETDEVAVVVRRCPTGALTYHRKDGRPEESAATRNRVVVANNGPLYLEGELEIEGAPDDMPGGRCRAALCRCGASKNKPFCDNSHESVDFSDRGAIGETGEPLESRGGPLRVSAAKDGPLLLRGSCEITASSGRTAWSGTKTALCRCGASENKPFCDGSHKEAGFRSK